jgi:murein endopeptidase
LRSRTEAVLTLALFLLPAAAGADVLPCAPVSDLVSHVEGGPDPGFCHEWNPEFAHNGHRCCGKQLPRGRARTARRRACAPKRTWKTAYCDEMTEAQRRYVAAASAGTLGDVLELIVRDRGRRPQAQCEVSDGFLSWGRPLVASAENRVRLRSGHRCLNFGTDPMIGLLEWVGRRVAARYADPEYAGVRLVVGDISAPRGGCLAGRRGRRGHSSHTSGQDADVGFLVARRGAAPEGFHRQFDPAANWWLLKEIFANPYGCVRVVFLDRNLIRKVARAARGDPAWDEYRRFVRHARGHRDHFHVRVGEGPGRPGCVPGADPGLEVGDEHDEPPETDDEAELRELLPTEDL